MASLRCINVSGCASAWKQVPRRVVLRSEAHVHALVPRHHHAISPAQTFGFPIISRHPIPCRSFSTSASRLATVCVRNNQVDEDGKPAHIELTARAAKRLSQIMVKEKNPDLALRVQVESGGCHGFQYLMSLVTLPPGADKDHVESSVVNDDDVVFQFTPEETLPPEPVMESGVPKMILDTASLDLLKGSKVDFVMELIGSEFKITDNPLATSSCGCGTSFDIKL